MEETYGTLDFTTLIKLVPLSLATLYWVYVGFIKIDIKNLHEHLRDGILIDEPQQAIIMERDLKKYIVVKENQAHKATIFAILFSVIALFWLFYLS